MVKVITQQGNTENKQLQHQRGLASCHSGQAKTKFLFSPLTYSSFLFGLLFFAFLLSLPSLVLPLCSSQKANCRLQSSGKVSNCNSLLRALSSHFGLRSCFVSSLFLLFVPLPCIQKGSKCKSLLTFNPTSFLAFPWQLYWLHCLLVCPTPLPTWPNQSDEKT